MFNYTETKTGNSNRHYSNRHGKLRNGNSKNRGPRDPFENTNSGFAHLTDPNAMDNGMMIGGAKVNVGARGPNPLVPSS